MSLTPEQQSLPVHSLVRQITGRATKWGMISGAYLGLLYGTLAILVPGIVAHVMTPKEALVVSSLPFVLSYATFGGLFGCVIGGFMGFVLGIINGLILGSITRRFFRPLTNIRRYRCVLGLASTAISLVAAWIGFGRNYTGPFDQEAVIFSVMPTIIAGLTGLVASQCLATWYARVTSEAQQGYEIK